MTKWLMLGSMVLLAAALASWAAERRANKLVEQAQHTAVACSSGQEGACGGGGAGVPGNLWEFSHHDVVKYMVPPGTTQLIIEHYGVGGGKPLCVTVKGQKSINGGGDGGDARVCGGGGGVAIGGEASTGILTQGTKPILSYGMITGGGGSPAHPAER